MKKMSLIMLVVSTALSSNVANAIDWNNWTSNVKSDNDHADSALSNQNFSTVQNNVNTIDTALTQSIATQDKLNKQQEALNQQQDELNQKQVESNANQLSWNQKQDNINTQQTEVNNKQTEVNNTQATLNSQQSSINQQQTEWNSTQENSLDKLHATNQGLAAANAQIVKENAQIARANTQLSHEVTRLDGGLNRLNQKVDRLDNKMNRGLASQAALSGLFQPYSVGKFNLSTSLGGYESTNALAVGTGYRFNENIAAKAGVSTNTENMNAVTYNAAINFEW